MMQHYLPIYLKNYLYRVVERLPLVAVVSTIPHRDGSLAYQYHNILLDANVTIIHSYAFLFAGARIVLIHTGQKS